MSYSIPAAIADTTIFPFSKGERTFVPSPVVGTPKTTPIQAYLIGKISKDFKIVQPLQINIEEEDDNSYIVSDDIFFVYGDGDNKLSALKEYSESLIEFYQIVGESSTTNEFDKQLYNQLRAYIQPLSARGYSDAIQTSTN